MQKNPWLVLDDIRKVLQEPTDNLRGGMENSGQEKDAAEPPLHERVAAIAKRFSEGWHDGIKIDATDIADLSEAAEAIRALKT